MGRKRYVPQYTSLFHSLLHAALPAEFPACLETYLELSLLYSPRPGMALVPGLPAHETYRLPVPAAELFRLAVFPRYTSTVTRVANAEIRRIVQAQLDKGWEERRLGAVRSKVASVVAVWVTTMFERKCFADYTVRDKADQCRLRRKSTDAQRAVLEIRSSYMRIPVRPMVSQ